MNATCVKVVLLVMALIAIPARAGVDAGVGGGAKAPTKIRLGPGFSRRGQYDELIDVNAQTKLDDVIAKVGGRSKIEARVRRTIPKGIYEIILIRDGNAHTLFLVVGGGEYRKWGDIPGGSFKNGDQLLVVAGED